MCPFTLHGCTVMGQINLYCLFSSIEVVSQLVRDRNLSLADASPTNNPLRLQEA